MKIRVYYPETEEGCKELNERIATAQAAAIINYIDNLNCSYEQKIELLKRSGNNTKE